MIIIKRMPMLLALLSAGALALSGCSRTNQDSPAAQTQSANVKPYPLQICAVSGEKLGSMGEPVVFVHEGHEIKLCCKSCRPDFNKEPAKFMAKIQSSKPTP